MFFLCMFACLGVADASDAYGKIDVSVPAIFGARVTFTITLKRTCPYYKWQYSFQNARQMFYDDDESIVLEKVNKTYVLTLKNATPIYHQSNISFLCDVHTVDTVTLELISK